MKKHLKKNKKNIKKNSSKNFNYENRECQISKRNLELINNYKN